MSSAELSTANCTASTMPMPSRSLMPTMSAMPMGILQPQQQPHPHSHSHFNSTATNDAYAFPPGHGHANHNHAHTHAHAHTHHHALPHNLNSNGQCRGSLPLKKRRFHEITSYHGNAANKKNGPSLSTPSLTSALPLPASLPLPTSSLPSSTQQQQQQQQQQQHSEAAKSKLMEQLELELGCSTNTNTTTDEKFAALALVAAATASGTGIFNDTTTATHLVGPYHGHTRSHTRSHTHAHHPNLSAPVGTASILQLPLPVHNTHQQLHTHTHISTTLLSGTTANAVTGALSLGYEYNMPPSSSDSNFNSKLPTTTEKVKSLKKETVKKSVVQGGNKHANTIKGVTPAATTTINNSNTTTTANANATSKPTQQRQRVNHPPLSSPIPGGCHGRTSRNNSYCRRTPCYNGSKYCKLHYQQYVVNGDNNTHSNDRGNKKKMDDSDNSNSSSSGGNGNGNGNGKNAHSLHSSNSNALVGDCVTNKSKGTSVGTGGNTNNKTIGGGAMTNTSSGDKHGQNSNSNHCHNHRHHQDKRYTGLGGANEVQCLATTTRGRPCAYVSVSGTKYCHLHADYDTNPPPRRGGGGGGGGGTNNSSGGPKSKSSTTSTTAGTGTGTTISSHCNTNESSSLLIGSNVASFQFSNDPSAVSPSLTSSSLDSGNGSSSSSTSQHTKMEGTNTQIKAEVHDKLKNIQSTTTGAAAGVKMNTNHPTLTQPQSQYALLNSIPSDKWSNKQVLIGTGTLVNHVGRVIKWGNGWVTVSTTTGHGSGSGNTGSGNEILHNRRAIELFLLPDDDSTIPTTSSASTSTNKTILEKKKDDITISSVLNSQNLKRNIPNSETSITTNTNRLSGIHKSDVLLNVKESSIKESNTKIIPVQNNLIKLKEKKVDKKVVVVKKIVNESKEKKESNIKLKSEDIDVNQSLKGKEEGIIAIAKKNENIVHLQPKICNSSLKEAIENVNKNKVSDIPVIEAQNKDTQLSSTLGKASPISSKMAESSLKIQVGEVDCLSLKSTEVGKKGESQDSDLLHSSKIEENANNNDISSSSENIVRSEPNQHHDNDKSEAVGQKLTLMEELILAQTGRRVKNVDLALRSGGGRTIHKPKRYEDKTLIRKKRNRQHGEDHDEEGTPLKRKKIAASPGSKTSCSNSPSVSGDLGTSTIKFQDSSQDNSQSLVSNSQEDHRIEKIKA